MHHHEIRIPTGQTQPTGMVWVQFFDDRIGRILRNSSRHMYRRDIEKSWTPVEPIVKQFAAGHKGQAQIQRLQFPLRPAHAKTVHRAQGDTMDTAVIDLTTRRKVDHIHYVAISRLRSLEGLHIVNLEEEKITINKEVQTEMGRLRSFSAETPKFHSLTSQGISKLFSLMPDPCIVIWMILKLTQILLHHTWQSSVKLDFVQKTRKNLHIFLPLDISTDMMIPPMTLADHTMESLYTVNMSFSSVIKSDTKQ
jgi:hypothetical protein